MEAKEGADNVAARLCGRHAGRRSSVRSGPYRCESCGCDSFVILTSRTITTRYSQTAPCACGKAARAARLEFEFREVIEARDELDDRHRVGERLDRAVVEREQTLLDSLVECQACSEASDEDDWTRDDVVEEEVEEETWVCCWSCGHEVEFGWSEPEAQGSIWPVEAADFDPALVWPEPRYSAAWSERGWIVHA